ncbi:MAG: AbrB/MazE/SpoVT family DNA-binding domain-containing protein [Myxococcota bacterium]
MKVAESKLTSQGQISVPAEIRRRLGLAPGSVLEWDVEGDVVIVRKSARFASSDVHQALFPDGPPKAHSLDELRDGLAGEIARRHARR